MKRRSNLREGSDDPVFIRGALKTEECAKNALTWNGEYLCCRKIRIGRKENCGRKNLDSGLAPVWGARTAGGGFGRKLAHLHRDGA